MSVELKLTKPEKAIINSLKTLADNPVAPNNIQEDPQVFKRIMADDFKAPFKMTPSDIVAGKNPPALPSNPGNANTVRRYFQYEKPLCDFETSAKINICSEDPDAAVENVGYLAMDIDKVAAHAWKTSDTDFKNILENQGERRARELRHAVRRIMQKCNIDAITEIYTNAGLYSGTQINSMTNPQVVTIIDEKARILPVGLSKIRKDYRKAKFNSGRFITLVGDVGAAYFDVRELERNENGNIGNGQGNLDFLYDFDIDNVIQGLAADTASHGLTVPIGSIFVDTYNANTGDSAWSTDHSISTTILIDGTRYDYEAKFDCGVWTEQLSLQYGFGGIPSEIYCDGNNLIRHWLMSCGTADCSVL